MELFPVSETQLEEIYESFDTNKNKIAESVAILEEWITKQPHLPQKFPFDNFLHRALSVGKYNVEKAKRKIDRFFTLKAFNKDFYTIFGTSGFLPPIDNCITVVPLPRLGPSNERIFVILANTPNAENFIFDHYTQLSLAVVELAALYDQTGSVRVLGDGIHYNFDFVKKIEWNKLYRNVQLSLNGYGGKVVSFDIINPLPAADLLFNAVKKITKNKIIQRVKFHKSLESLYQDLPPKYLPEEYGGSNGNISDLREKVNAAVIAHKDYIASGAEYVSDESLRIGEIPYQNDTFGIEGTFKNLSLD